MEKVNEVIGIINEMDIKDRLRVGICMSESAYTKLKYNKSHIHSIFDKRLKQIDNEYLTSYVIYMLIDYLKMLLKYCIIIITFLWYVLGNNHINVTWVSFKRWYFRWLNNKFMILLSN